MMRLALALVLFSFSAAMAQRTAEEERQVDAGIEELCSCFNSIIASFDSTFQKAFELSVQDNGLGKMAIKDYIASLDSAQKSNFVKKMGLKITNTDSELNQCALAIKDKYNFDITIAGDDQKKYLQDKFDKIEACSMMSKIMLQLNKKKQ